MDFAETIRVALGALRANKMRSLLTMLGIVIGVSAVIAVVALGRGAQQAVKDRISSLGTTLLTVSPGQARAGGVMSFDVRSRLTLEDAMALEESGHRDHRGPARDVEHPAGAVPQQERGDAGRRDDGQLPRGPQIRARGGASSSPPPRT